VVVLDDDPTFLDSFTFRLGERFLCRAFARSRAALAHIRANTLSPPRASHCLSHYSESTTNEDWSPADRTVTVRPARIRDLVHDANRFAEISVLVVDYDMPDLDGLAVCRALNESPVRRIMLTGKADEKTALAAFNEHIIDSFIIKQDPQVTEKVEDAIRRQQEEYFSYITSPLTRMLSLEGPNILTDKQFMQYFKHILIDSGCIEYYLSAEPPGFFLVRADGAAYFLLVQSEDALRYHEEMARDCGTAPRDLLAALARRDHQPWFPTPYGYYDISCFSWHRYLHAAKCIGTGGWYCSLIETGIILPASERPLLSCDAYRQRIELSGDH
jgi:CheY-like chemotaxis protein